MAYEKESSKVFFHNPGGEEELMPLTSAYNNNNNNNNNSLFTPPSQWNSLKDGDGFHSYFLSELYRYYQQKPSSPITKQLIASIIDSFDRRLPPSYDDHHKAGMKDEGAIEEKDGAKLLSLSGEKKEMEKEEGGLVKEKDYSETDKEFNDRSIWKMVSSDVLKRVKNENIDLVNIKKSSGLTDEEAAKRLTENGPNVLTPPPEKPEILKYLLFYLDPFMLLLVGAGILSCIAYGIDKTQPINLWIGIVLFVVVLISCTFSYFQEGAATAVMKSFKKLLPRNARVIRGGQIKTVPASELVVGDLAVIQGGDQCPADLRMLFASNVKLETSALTGESVPVTSATIASSELKMEEARNIAFNTCYVIEGEGYGVVVATGDNSVIGKIAKLASGDGNEPLTPIQKEIKMFVKKIAVFALTMGIIFFVIGLARGQKPISAFINGCIVVMIAMVPEGLPMTVVSALAIVAKRMGKLNVFIKQLRSVETLGSATVIASDKTGTITQNKMTVSRLWFDGAPFSADTLKRDFPAYDIRRRVRIGGNSGFTVKGNSATMKKKAIELSQNHLGDTLYQLELCAGVCNRAKYEDEKVLTDDEADMINAGSVLRSLDPAMTLRSARDAFPVLASHIDPTMTLRSAIKKFDVRGGTNKTGDSKIIGDASDTGLFNYVKNRSSVEMLRYHYRLLLEIPFNSRVKYAMSIVKPYRVDGAQNRILLIKGAPEVILTKCSHQMVKGVPHPIDDSFRSSFTEAYEMFGGYGERVLGFAQLVLDLKQYPPEYDNQYNAEKNNFPQSGYCFLGLISLIDPPKPTVFDAIASCHTAGVKVMMVTGDHPLTAAAIARQVGIITQPTRDVLAKARGVSESAIDESEVNAVVVRGVDIESYSEADWNRVLTKQEIVFARTTPTHKLEIVKNLQRLNHIVAVTGDGVNDSPALKQADLGVAMGISGSDVARNAADVIIMDDDLASIVVGIREGRTIFDNLAKTTAYTVSHMLPEVVPILLNLAFGFPVILPALFILVIDLGTELAPAISLAYETAEGDIMTRPPRDSKKDRLVSLQVALYFIFQAGLVQTLSCFLAFFLVLNHHGIPPSAIPFSSDKYFLASDSDCRDRIGDACTLVIDGKSFTLSHQRDILNQAQTAYWTMLTASQVVHIFLNKTRKLSIFSHGLFDNTVMLFGVTIEIALIIIIIYVPFVQSFIGTTEFTARYWSIILVPITALFLINEPKKWLARKYPGSVFDKWLTF